MNLPIALVHFRLQIDVLSLSQINHMSEDQSQGTGNGVPPVPNIWNNIFDPVRCAACCACEHRRRTVAVVSPASSPIAQAVTHGVVDQFPADLFSGSRHALSPVRMQLPAHLKQDHVD
jgi:hypothetical protein